MVPQHKLRGRKSVRTQPGTHGGGIIQDVLQATFPGLFTSSGIQQGLQSVKHGRFNAVANAANLPLAALVGGGKAGNAQGIRPGNTAVFKPEDSRGHLSFCSIHWLESWFPWSKRQWRRIQGGKRLAEAALSPTEPSSRSGNDPSLPEVDGDARGWNGLLPDVVSALLPAAAAFRRRYEWMMNVQKRHAGNSWERVMAHAS